MTLAGCLGPAVENAAAASTQSISWAQQGPYAYGAAAPVLNARASSGLTVSYSVASGNCWLFGTNLIFRVAGSCVINAAQGGNASYSPASTVPQKITTTAYVPRTGSVLTTAMTATGAANETGLVSTCPVGSFVVGIEPYLMPVTSWVAGAQAICGNVAGAAPGGYVGLMGGYASSGPSTGLVCPVGELAVGVYGNTGTYTATMGPRCAVPGIAAVNGPSGGGGGGSAAGPFDCPSGDALIGLKGTVATGSGSDALMSLQGICGAASQVATATSALQGSGQANVIGAVSMCPSGQFVTGITRYAASAGWTAGVSAICNVWQGAGGNASTIGGAGSVSSDWTKCSPQMSAISIQGRAGTWLDAVGFYCAAYNTGGLSVDSNGTDGLLGDSGGSQQGLFDCPPGDAMIGLQGSYNTTAYSGSDVMTSLKGICETYPGGFGSAASKPMRYKGSDHKGAVRFRMLVRHRSVLGKAAVYQYILYDLRFATACSTSGLSVPGQVTANGRVSAGKRQRFTLRTKSYLLTGRIFGSLATPKVKGTLKVLHGTCGGEVLRFSARLAG